MSVVMAVYNGRPYLRETVDAIGRQTQPPAELVIIDDGSTDGGTDEIADIDLPFAVVIERQPNAGQSAARNKGVLLATGELIAFIDQDDLWHPEHLRELCSAFADDPSVGWVYSDFDEIDEAGRVVTLSFHHEHGLEHPKRTLGACLAADLMVLPSASMLRRTAFEAIGGFDEDLHGHEDDDLYVRTFRSGWRIVYVERSLTRFRVHSSSSSANGAFAESRMRYSRKLRAAIADDRRVNRYWFRDVVAPRFFTSSVDDYVRAVSDRDWAAARRAFVAVEHFAHERRQRMPAWKLALLRNPVLFRQLLWLNDRLPASWRPAKSPIFRLR